MPGVAGGKGGRRAAEQGRIGEEELNARALSI
jgi:hypothetical protein